MSERRALFGAVALSLVNVLKYGLQLMVLPVLARILGPDAFGLVGLAMPFILLANMMSDAGMGVALVREPNPSRELESTVFWLALAVGVSMTLVICLAAWPLAMIFNQPRLAPVLAVLSIIMTIGASLSVSNARVSRSRRFELFAIGEMIASVVSAVVGIGSALAGLGAWSLVASQLSLWLVKALWLFPVTRFVPLLSCRPSLARKFVTFGLHSVGANLADFGSKNIAPLVIGRILGVTAVGHYALGWQLNRIPDSVISGPVYLSVFTAVANAQADGRPTAPLVLHPMRMLVLALAPLFAGLALIADVAVSVLLGAKWEGTAPVLAALAPAGFLLCLFSIVGATLMGLGRPDRQFRLTLGIGAAILVGAAGGAAFGLTEVGLGVSLACAVAAPWFVRALCQELRIAPAELLSGMGGPAFATAGMAIVVLLVRRAVAHTPDAVQLVAAVVAGAAAYSALLLLVARRQVIADLRGLAPAKAATASAAADRTRAVG